MRKIGVSVDKTEPEESVPINTATDNLKTNNYEIGEYAPTNIPEELIASLATAGDIITHQDTLKMCAFDCSSEETKECIKCKRLFCIYHSSRVTPNACQDCFKAFSLIVDKFERRVEDYDDVTDTVNVRKESCKRLKFDGPDWVFYTGWVDKLTDEELKIVWEFHFFILKIIEHDNETRKIKAAGKLRGQKIPGMGVVTTTDTRTKRVAKPKDPLVELRKAMPGQTEEFYKKMLAVMTGS